jgi:hypothetical protein
MGNESAISFLGPICERLESEIVARQGVQNFRIAIVTALIAVLSAVLGAISTLAGLLALIKK